MEVWIKTRDHNGKKAEYLLSPESSLQPSVVESMPADGQAVSVGVPDTDAFVSRIDLEVAAIHSYEANETPVKKFIRKSVDYSLDYPGTIGAAALAGYEVYEKTDSPWLGLAASFGGFVVHEFGKRPFIGLRHLIHGVMNPWSPAMQSNALLRRDILNT